MGEQHAEQPHKPDVVEPHLSGINSWVHEAIRETYSHFGDGKDRNSAGSEHRNLAVKTLDFLQIVPYAEYYVSYHAAKGINQVGRMLGVPAVAHVVAAPFTIGQSTGLLGNELISAGVLALNHGKANLYEGIRGTVVPHFAWNNAPRVYLPGIHANGKIDFEW